jgi:hypothetical protein
MLYLVTNNKHEEWERERKEQEVGLAVRHSIAGLEYSLLDNQPLYNLDKPHCHIQAPLSMSCRVFHFLLAPSFTLPSTTPIAYRLANSSQCV